MKRKLLTVLSVLLTAALIVGMVPCAYITAGAETSGDYEYTVNDDGETVTITKYNGSDSEVTIPSEIDGKKVTNIRYFAFNDSTSLESIKVDENNENYSSIDGVLYNKDKTELIDCPKAKTSITIPDSVTKIWGYAFSGCALLESITIPDTVTNIGENAFYGCTSLKNITIPDLVTIIGYFAFYGCTALESITIPDSVTTIGNNAFYSCTSLKSITIPDSVTEIMANVFYGCTSLENVTIGNAVTTIGNNVFNGCTSLETINVGENSENYCSIDGVLYNKDKTELIACPRTKTSITIPDSVTTIGESAFNGCTSLESITIPESVTIIGYYAFYGCTSLTRVTIPDSLTTIDARAFYNCTSLESITIPESVTIIGYYAFYGCTSLESITIPDLVTKIDSGAFSGCTSLESINVGENNEKYSSIDGILCNKDKTELIDCPGAKTSITIPDSVTGIWRGAFDSCTSLESINVGENSEKYSSIDGALYYKAEDIMELMVCPGAKTSITIPNSVTTIDRGAFSGCTSLESINVGENNENYSSVDGVLYNKDKTKLIACPGAKTSITIPDSVTTIDSGAFSGCTSLESINVGENNKNYSSVDGVLYNKDKTTLISCPKAKKSVTIPDSVTTISLGAFLNCTSLTGITIPDSVTEIDSFIDSSAFHSCESLTIYGYKGSYAEKYAFMYIIPFKALDELPDTDSETDTTTDTASDKETDTTTDTTSDKETDTTTDTASDTETDTTTDTASDMETDTTTDTTSDTETDTTTDTASDTETDTTTDTASDTETNTTTDTASDMETDTTTDTTSDTDSDTSTDTSTDTPKPDFKSDEKKDWSPEQTDGLVLDITNADITDLTEVTVNGEKVDPSNYTVIKTETGVAVTLTPEFLKTLASGSYDAGCIQKRHSRNADHSR